IVAVGNHAGAEDRDQGHENEPRPRGAMEGCWLRHPPQPTRRESSALLPTRVVGWDGGPNAWALQGTERHAKERTTGPPVRLFSDFRSNPVVDRSDRRPRTLRRIRRDRRERALRM